MIELLLRYSPDTPAQVVGDPGRIRQIATNLAGNAIKFTAQGHVLISIACSRQTPEQAYFQFAVEDTGIGIPADKLAVYSTDSPRRMPRRRANMEGRGWGWRSPNSWSNSWVGR